jgi:hypothetical protein
MGDALEVIKSELTLESSLLHIRKGQAYSQSVDLNADDRGGILVNAT